MGDLGTVSRLVVLTLPLWHYAGDSPLIGPSSKLLSKGTADAGNAEVVAVILYVRNHSTRWERNSPVIDVK